MSGSVSVFEPIAVIGQGCVLPGALSPAQLWSLSVEGQVVISAPPPGHWRLDPESVYSRGAADPKGCDIALTTAGGYVTGFEQVFDPNRFGSHAALAATLDPVFQWTLHACDRALLDAGFDGMPSNVACGLILGNLSYPSAGLTRLYETQRLEELLGLRFGDAEPWLNRFSSGLPAMLTARILGLSAESFCLDAACASSLYAIKLACDRLQNRSADLMLAGGVNAADSLFLHIGFSALQAMSPSGRSRPFNKNADGLIPAEGAGILVLKRLADAVHDGDAIAGVIRGVGLTNDGRGGLLTPSEVGQARSMRLAYRQAGMSMSELGYLECHATGTSRGDANEIRSVRSVWGRESLLPISSLKANMGHLVTASGVAGMIRIMGALQHQMLPRTPDVAPLNGALEGSGLEVLQEVRPWPVTARPRVAAINNFGFGGNNAHLIIQEYRPELIRIAVVAPDVADAEPVAVVALAARAASAPSTDHILALLREDATPGDANGDADSLTLDIRGMVFTPNDLKASLGQQLIALGLLEDIRPRLKNLIPEETGVYVGMGVDPEISRYGMRWRMATLLEDQPALRAQLPALKDAVIAPLSAADVLGKMPNIPASRISNQYNFRGPGFTVSGEELSGNYALDIALEALRRGEITAAVVGAVDWSVDPVHALALARAAEAAGVAAPTLGAGGVVMAIKPLSRARADGDAIYAVLDPTPNAISTIAVTSALRERALDGRLGHIHAAAGLLDVALGVVAASCHAAIDEGQLVPYATARADERYQVESRSLHGAPIWRRVLRPAPDAVPDLGLLPDPALYIFSGASRVALLEAVRADRLSWSGGPFRIAFLARDAEAYTYWRDQALAFLTSAALTPPAGLDFRTGPRPGERIFTFSGIPAPAAEPSRTRLRFPLRMPDIHFPDQIRADVIAPLARPASMSVAPAFAVPAFAPATDLWGSLEPMIPLPPISPVSIGDADIGGGPSFDRDFSNFDFFDVDLFDRTTVENDMPDYPDAQNGSSESGELMIAVAESHRILSQAYAAYLQGSSHLRAAHLRFQRDSLTTLSASGSASATAADATWTDLPTTPEVTPLPPLAAPSFPPAAPVSPPVALVAPTPLALSAFVVATPGATSIPAPKPVSRAAPVVDQERRFRPVQPGQQVLQRPVYLGRKELEILAGGKISSIFGPLFEQQDQYSVQCRMPEPPLLLCDRVIDIEGAAGSMKLGTVWTESDIRRDSWYLFNDRVPPGIMIESGQADLLLISWLGIDFIAKGERAYRLLGCEMSFTDVLPRAGDTLKFDIHVDGHARQGDIRLFFFHYDCHVGDRLVTKVRNGQAGFFSKKELAESGGVLWTPEEATYTQNPRLVLPEGHTRKQRFTPDDIAAYQKGDMIACFGPEFRRTQTHTRTPRSQDGKMCFIQRVDVLDFKGGPAGRGYLRSEADIHPDDWFFKGHFKNDECMPGTLMADACLQMMSFYMVALGYTTTRDGWRFEPVINETFSFVCRGQVTPGSKKLVYEVFVDEIIDGPEPALYAHVLCTTDGLKSFMCERFAVRLIPDWPLYAMYETLDHAEVFSAADTRKIAEVDGFRFDYRALLCCAWGRPTESFGPLMHVYDQTARCPALPSPPYHFMTRVAQIEGEAGVPKNNSKVVVEYDFSASEWYFAESDSGAMPFAVLMEVALQPCGWLSVYTLEQKMHSTQLLYRNLDGTATLNRLVRPEDGRIRTEVTLLATFKAAGNILQKFDVKCYIGDSDEQIYAMQTAFGFFPPAVMVNQAGLPVSAAEKARFALPENCQIRLKSHPEAYFGGSARLASGKLLMIDRVVHFSEGDADGKGTYVRSLKDVDPSEWFFKSHFFQDPVQPGSLGVEAIVQLLQFTMLRLNLHQGMTAPHFETVITGKEVEWHYRGQVPPDKELITVDLVITETGTDDRGRYALADACFWVDGLKIYQTPRIGMRLVESRA